MHHIYTIRVAEARRQIKQKKNIEGIRLKTFQNILSKKSAYTKSLMNSKKDKYRDPQHFIINILTVKDKEKLWKLAGDEGPITYKGIC